MEPAYNALFDFSHIRCIYPTNVMKHKNKFIRKKKQSVNKKILFVTYFIKLVLRFMSLKS